MKDERATGKAPVIAIQRKDPRVDVLKRISLAILENSPADLANERGNDPYNTTSGRTQPELWDKQRHRR